MSDAAIRATRAPRAERPDEHRSCSQLTATATRKRKIKPQVPLHSPRDEPANEKSSSLRVLFRAAEFGQRTQFSPCVRHAESAAASEPFLEIRLRAAETWNEVLGQFTDCSTTRVGERGMFCRHMSGAAGTTTTGLGETRRVRLSPRFRAAHHVASKIFLILDGRPWTSAANNSVRRLDAPSLCVLAFPKTLTKQARFGAVYVCAAQPSLQIHQSWRGNTRDQKYGLRATHSALPPQHVLHFVGKLVTKPGNILETVVSNRPAEDGRQSE
ncbi:hypothetical protein HPB48_025498 [Haemaphysalis longicornis]|uniref:Uncharacterized protein n=1 Tax=Haemaphysalis longicornis TaxID=44386 RepID=A0A9J6H8Y7_HAELO|nr:hypothetical protein HPB48_025498 [Haemaphysalis longicornis]